MDPWMIHTGFTAILAILGYLMKMSIAENQRLLEKHAEQIDHIKDTYFKKQDFSEFKQELWQRLDRFEQDVKDQLNSKNV